MTSVMPDQRLLGPPGLPLDAGTPPYYDPDRRSWQVFSYDDVDRLARDAACFSQGFADPASTEPNDNVMWVTDGPRHHDLRRLVRDPFSRTALAGLAPGIRALTDQLMDDIERHGGPFEVVTELAAPLPGQVICQIMGLDLAANKQFGAWLSEFAAGSAAVHETIVQTDKAAFFADLLAERRRCPAGGLVDELIAAQAAGYQVAGQPLSDLDLIGYLWGLVAAGTHTTHAAIASTLLLLAEWGGWDELRADPGLRDGAIAECLRLAPPFPTIGAVATRPVTFGGVEIPAGQMVTGSLWSAGRDPARFPDPGLLDPRRPNTGQHPAFAFGPHRCLGEPLALQELRTVVYAATDRWAWLRWDRELPFGRAPLTMFNNVAVAWMSYLGRQP
jgi:cytochrome P450